MRLHTLICLRLDVGSLMSRLRMVSIACIYFTVSLAVCEESTQSENMMNLFLHAVIVLSKWNFRRRTRLAYSRVLLVGNPRLLY